MSTEQTKLIGPACADCGKAPAPIEDDRGSRNVVHFCRSCGVDRALGYLEQAEERLDGVA